MRYAKSTKLSKEIVVNIHNKKAQGISVINIAKEYKVTRRCIYHILQGKNWNDLHPTTAIATVS
jgi:DNA invertase Pin-like site-specific DNA recombinase